MAKKAKTHSGASKRFRRSASGRIKVRTSKRAHILTKKTKKVKRQRRANLTISACDQKAIARQLDGC